jgi:cytochrome b involved in lipid metabolism
LGGGYARGVKNFKRNEVWSLIERPKLNVVGTKWVFHNKKDKCEVVIRNKAQLVTKTYSQVEDLDFDETFAPIAWLESIHILLAYATHHDCKLYQMDVKSTFLNGPIKEEVYMRQPPGFKSEEYPNHVYKLHKALYRLKHAPRAWYECLRNFLIGNSFGIDKCDYTLFTRRMRKDLVVCQIYVDDIIFDSTNKSFCDEFSKIMTDRFEMFMIGVLTFFLEFQIKQVKDETFINQMKYTRDILKKFGMDNAKPIKTLMGTNDHLNFDMGGISVDQKVYHSIIESLFYLCAFRPNIMLSVCMCVRFQVAPKDYHLRAVKRIMRYLVLAPNLGLWYPKGSYFELIGYSNADYTGCKVDRKIPPGLANFLIGPLSLGL